MSDFEPEIRVLSNLNDKLEQLLERQLQITSDIEVITKNIRSLEISIRDKQRTKTPNENRAKKSPTKLTLDTCKTLIGSRVRIKNPKAGQPNEGRIEKVGNLYVIVRLNNNQTTRRIPRNLSIIHHE